MTIPLRQVLWATAEYLAYPLAMFALAPFFVLKLGVHGYGLWMMLIALSGFGGVAGFGMGMAATREIAAIRGRSEPGLAGEVIRTCVVTSLCGVALLWVLYGLAWMVLPVGLLERLGSREDVAMLLLASGIVVLFEQVDGVFAGALRGAERFDRSSRAEILSKLGAIGLCVLCALVTPSFKVFLAVVALGAAMRMVVKAAMAVRLLGPLRYGSGFHWRTNRAMIGFGGWVWVQSLGAFLFAAADRLLIGSLLGPASVAAYATFTQLVQQIHAIPSAGASVLYPMASRMQAERTSARPVVGAMMGLVMVVAVLLAVAVWVAGDWLIATWMGDAFAAQGEGVLDVLTLGYLLLAASIVPYYVLLARGSVRSVSALSLLAGVVAVAYCWWALPGSGLAGAAWGKVVYAAVLLAGMPLLLRVAWRR